MNFEDTILTWIAENFGVDRATLRLDLPPKPEIGDYAFACYPLARSLKKAPPLIAEEIVSRFPRKNFLERIEADGPFVNFTLHSAAFVPALLTLCASTDFGVPQLKQSVLIEHTSTNPNAPPHVGRARNALLGDSMKRILSAAGADVKAHFYVNDIGKQIALLVLGCKDQQELTFEGLLHQYIAINKRMKEEPALEQEVFTLLGQLEQGNKETIAAFKRVVTICIEGQATLLKRAGIVFDSFDYESDFLWNGETEAVIEAYRTQDKLAPDDHGRAVLDLSGFKLPMKSPVFVLTRNDGTSLYGLRDIAYTRWKLKQADRSIQVLGEDQKLYAQQISAALSLLDLPAPEVHHYSFVLLKDGKMSTRQGNVVLFEDFLNEAQERALVEVQKRQLVSASDEQQVALQIALGAVKFSILKISAEKNVTFDWEDALSFEGESGPYVQYTHARICRLLEKLSHLDDVQPSYEDLGLHERILLRRFLGFIQALADATQQLKPAIVAHAVYQLAKSYNEFYQNCSLKEAEEPLAAARFQLTRTTQRLLAHGLYLLGIEAPERM